MEVSLGKCTLGLGELLEYLVVIKVVDYNVCLSTSRY